LTTKTSSKKREVRAKFRGKFKKRRYWIIVLTILSVLAICVVTYYSVTRRSGEKESSFWRTNTWAEEGKVIVIGSPTIDCFTESCQLEIAVKNNSSEVIIIHGVVLYFLINGDLRRVDVVINETLNPGDVKSFTSAIKGIDLSMITNIQSGELITSIGKVRLGFKIPI
jgi:hypothetical protein